jgi:hypothetical protein
MTAPNQRNRYPNSCSSSDEGFRIPNIIADGLSGNRI